MFPDLLTKIKVEYLYSGYEFTCFTKPDIHINDVEAMADNLARVIEEIFNVRCARE
jgi:hypothetical protein